MMKRTLIILAPLLLLFVGAVLVTQVFAHAAYDHSTPAQDEVVPTAPALVDVYFKEEIAKVQGQYFVRVFNDQNAQVSTPDDGTVDDDNRKHMFAQLSPNLPNGRYIVRWSDVSFEDGDPAEGAFCFYVGVQPNAAQQAECAALSGVTPTVATAVASPAASATAPVATVSETPQPSPSPTVAPSSGGGGGGTPVALIIGGVIGGAVVLAIVAGGVFVWLRRLLE